MSQIVYGDGGSMVLAESTQRLRQTEGMKNKTEVVDEYAHRLNERNERRRTKQK